MRFEAWRAESEHAEAQTKRLRGVTDRLWLIRRGQTSSRLLEGRVVPLYVLRLSISAFAGYDIVPSFSVDRYNEGTIHNPIGELTGEDLERVLAYKMAVTRWILGELSELPPSNVVGDTIIDR